MAGAWIRRPEHNTAIVFVHGILSSSKTCWTNDNGAYWPDLLRNDIRLRSVGIYEFNYRSDFFSGNYRLGDAVDDLKEHLRLDGVIGSAQLLFVCHSMGGIVVRKYLCQQQAELIQREVKVGLFLIASPSLGSHYANWIAALAKIVGNSQADALRFHRNNAWLNDLDKDFRNLKEANKLTIVGRELIENDFILLPIAGSWIRRFWRQPIVDEISAARYFGEPSP